MESIIQSLEKSKFSCAGIIIYAIHKNDVLFAIGQKKFNSFPKGKRDKTDHNVLDNALREAEEEGGFNLNNISLIRNAIFTENDRICYFLAKFIGDLSTFEFKFDAKELNLMEWMTIDEANLKFSKERNQILTQASNKIKEIIGMTELDTYSADEINQARTKIFVMNKDLVNKSKKLSGFLRHRCPHDLIDESGWVDVRHTGLTIKELNQIVNLNDKGRFEISDDQMFIRALQGHSIAKVNSREYKLDNPDFGILNKELNVHEVVHATDISVDDPLMKLIVNSEFLESDKIGLSRMLRNDIHMVNNLENDRIKHPRFRTLIFVNLEKAMADGIEFYQTKNNCILSPGNHLGVIPQKYLRVEKIK